MSKVTAEISMSLDGFVAGPNDGVDNGLGDRGEKLHEWVLRLRGWREAHGYEGGETGPDDERFAAAIEATGAIVMGRRMFDHGEGPWGDEPPFHKPVFVLTHRPHESLVKEGGTTFTFVDGIESAVEQAREAAGDKNVAVAGGGQAIREAIEAGLLDELEIHLVPVLLGGGVPLFDFDPATAARIELEPIHAIDGPGVTHLRFGIGMEG
ncbi:MAG TPA: dihydrofolate reductase family protein [Solirubrobacterales bacterium]|nr:dihydrofolate reductase family protein [Solirubrobacterales bacterium]